MEQERRQSKLIFGLNLLLHMTKCGVKAKRFALASAPQYYARPFRVSFANRRTPRCKTECMVACARIFSPRSTARALGKYSGWECSQSPFIILVPVRHRPYLFASQILARLSCSSARCVALMRFAFETASSPPATMHWIFAYRFCQLWPTKIVAMFRPPTTGRRKQHGDILRLWAEHCRTTHRDRRESSRISLCHSDTHSLSRALT